MIPRISKALTLTVALALAVVLASTASANLRHTSPVPVSFIAVARDSTERVPANLIFLDVNANGVIDGYDLQQLVGAVAEDRGEDANGDGAVDVLDLALAARYFGASIHP